jgi:hypothetical protein
MAKRDPIERLLSIDDYQEFLLKLRSYNVNIEDMKKQWKEKRKPKAKPALSTTNRSMQSTFSTKKVVTETSVSNTLDEE